jgi:hypothetical protein
MGHQETQPQACPSCGWRSYSWGIWQWCPRCDSDHKPGPARQERVRELDQLTNREWAESRSVGGVR